ncbi:MAG: hypothetical protein DWQ10_07240 [Calditrichaeota bacterium]|nr:MAG: hypothetical protein DWQ10_07240 [Calditrichota bacterium]
MRVYKIFILLILPCILVAQPSWKRSAEPVKPEVELFHVSQMPDLPTTETLQKGSFMYEISHRFGSFNSGYEGMYGFDGPVTMRMALSFGVTNRFMATVGRSSLQDNLDIRLKYKTLQFSSSSMPTVVALQAGAAFNTESYAGLVKRESFDSNSKQFYGQIVFNTMFLQKKLGLGIIPSVVYNSFIFANDYAADKKYTVSIPVYTQYYINRMWSIWTEYMPVVAGWKGNLFYDAADANRSHNSISSGIAIETGGHVFYLFATNNTRLNPTQYLVGAPASADDRDAWRIAFCITRELH